MPTARGFQGVAGIVKEVTLGTVVAVTTKLPLISESLSDQFAHIQNAALTGSATRGRAIQGARSAGGQLVCYWNYDVRQPLLEQFFGTWTDGDPDEDYYTMDATIDGKGLTIAIEKTVSVHEFAGVKVGAFTLSGSPSDGVRWTADVFAQSRSLTSVTNTTAVLAALAEAGDPMQFHDLTLRIGDQANDLASGDDVEMENFSLAIGRNMIQKQVNSTTLLEARENGFQDGTLTVQLPLYDSDQFLTWHASHTPLQASLIATFGTFTKYVNLPNILVTSANPVLSGPELVGYTVSFSVHNNAAGDNASTDMDFAEAIRIFELNS
jgi:hypothetical protein